MVDEGPLLYELEDYERITGRPFDKAFNEIPELPESIPIRRIAISASVKSQVWEKTGGICIYCGIPLNPFHNFSIDHEVPISKGGTDDVSNLVPCCRRCNSGKGAT